MVCNIQCIILTMSVMNLIRIHFLAMLNIALLQVVIIQNLEIFLGFAFCDNWCVVFTGHMGINCSCRIELLSSQCVWLNFKFTRLKKLSMSK